MQHRADVELARRAADANPVAFESLFSDAIERVHAFVLRRTPSPEAAQRVSERALTRMFASLARYEGSDSFAAWLLVIVKQELRNDALATRPSAAPPPVAPPPPRRAEPTREVPLLRVAAPRCEMRWACRRCASGIPD